MIATLEPPSPLDQWRQRLGGRRRRAQPRPLAAMGYMANGPVSDGLIAVENLTIILLYDQPIRGGRCAFRLKLSYFASDSGEPCSPKYTFFPLTRENAWPVAWQR